MYSRRAELTSPEARHLLRRFGGHYLAAVASAGSFAIGGLLPLIVTLLAPADWIIPSVALASLLFLALLGGGAARTGGAPVFTGATRVTFWGAMAMAVTAGVGALWGAT